MKIPVSGLSAYNEEKIQGPIYAGTLLEEEDPKELSWEQFELVQKAAGIEEQVTSEDIVDSMAQHLADYNFELEEDFDWESEENSAKADFRIEYTEDGLYYYMEGTAYGHIDVSKGDYWTPGTSEDIVDHVELKEAFVVLDDDSKIDQDPELYDQVKHWYDYPYVVTEEVEQKANELLKDYSK